VCGNVDVFDTVALRRTAVELSQTCHDRFADLELEGVRVAMLHGDDGRRLRETIESQDYDLVCFGHTHRMEHRREAATTVLNPGALYRARPHSLAIVTMPEVDVRFIELP
jgi:predicted phosphodiesterase